MRSSQFRFQKDACTWRIQTAELSPAWLARFSHGVVLLTRFDARSRLSPIPWCLNVESNQTLIGNSRSDHRSGQGKADVLISESSIMCMSLSYSRGYLVYSVPA